ncbi:unnamed protein product [Mycena citricolor]|uniref:Uncharacterized protein n=1 Tax=Mycena citricolor TaxID=2018698 RepID=A0AAD2HR57_9AGAR|nr:unnamed protein product [Mycena citricolor]
MDPKRLDQWDAVQQHKFIVTVSGGNSDRRRTTTLIRNLIAEATNARGHHIMISEPSVAQSGPDPTCWLVAGLPVEVGEHLVEGRIISSPAITLLIHAYAPPISGYIGAFTGFNVECTQEGAETIRRIIGDTILKSPSTVQLILDNRDAFSELDTNSEVLERFTATLHVQPMEIRTAGNQDILLWNLFANPPTCYIESWRKIAKDVRRLVFGSIWDGQAYLYTTGVNEKKKKEQDGKKGKSQDRKGKGKRRHDGYDHY